MLRWIGLGAAALVALLIAAGAGLYLAAGRIELAGFVASRASTALGRAVTIGSLRLEPNGAWARITLHDAALANAEGGSAPAMATIRRLVAEVHLPGLLRDAPPTLRGVEVDGFALLLERGTGPGKDAPNWRFGPPHPPGTAPPDRSGIPLLLDAAISDAEVVFRTGSGHALRMRMDTARIAAEAVDTPVSLQVTGSYNAAPIGIAATLGATAMLRDTATPFPVVLTATTGDTRLGFTGTMTDPLNADGATGRLTLAAPTPAALLRIAGADLSLDLSLDLAGAATRQGDVWRLADAAGTLSGSPLTAPLLQLTEGSSGRPDAVVARLAVERLDLNRILGDAQHRQGARDPQADLPLDLDPQQDPLVEAEVAVGALAYATMRATGVRVKGRLGAGTVDVDTLALAFGGANITATLHARAEPAGGARIDAAVALADSDLDAMRRALGIRALPLAGRVDGRLAVSGQGRTLNAAAHGARVSAVVGLRQGSIAREVIEMASTDVRLLFRTPKGNTPMTCLLGLVDMRAGIGDAAPIRIRAATGTITGLASFDLFRERVDLVIGSQRDTTNFFALDVPVRIAGSFGAPSIRPATCAPSRSATRAIAAAVRPPRRGPSGRVGGDRLLRPRPNTSRGRPRRRRPRRSRSCNRDWRASRPARRFRPPPRSGWPESSTACSRSGPGSSA